MWSVTLRRQVAGTPVLLVRVGGRGHDRVGLAALLLSQSAFVTLGGAATGHMHLVESELQRAERACGIQHGAKQKQAR